MGHDGQRNQTRKIVQVNWMGQKGQNDHRSGKLGQKCKKWQMCQQSLMSCMVQMGQNCQNCQKWEMIGRLAYMGQDVQRNQTHKIFHINQIGQKVQNDLKL